MLYPRFRTRTRFLMAIGSLAVALVACQINLGGPQAPAPPIEVGSRAASSLKKAWRSATGNAPKGEITILLNESQLTSFLALRLQEMSKPILSQPQVYLRSGQLQLFGIAQEGPFQASLLIAIAPIVDSKGAVSFEVISLDLGPLTMPEAIKGTLSAILTEAFTGSLGPHATGLQINTIAISDGEMAIVGKLR